MGQAAVDLPDPVGGANAAHAASADDLLSQLAGDEIDRLLAEADVEAEAQKTSDTPDAKIDLPEHEDEQSPDLGSQIDSAIEQAAPPVDSATPVAGVAIPAETKTEPIQKQPDAPQAPAIPEAVEPPVAAPAEPSSAAGSDEETSAQERSALAIEEPATSDADVSNPDEAAAHAADETLAPLPIYLRPLEWLNAPLAACPEAVREAVGKVAIITLVNAVAVLAYVLIFRK